MNRPTMFFSGLLSACLWVSPTAGEDRPDTVIEDFDHDFQKWDVVGNAFGSGPVSWDDPRDPTWTVQVTPNGKMKFATSWGMDDFLRDRVTGEMTLKQTIEINRRYLNIRRGGGNIPGKLAIEALVDGQVIGFLGGNGREDMEWGDIDLTAHQGKAMRVRLVDRHAAGDGLGHINVKEIVLSDTPKTIYNQTREMPIAHRYLWLPIDNDALRGRLSFSVDGKPVHICDIRLAPGEPDWWAFFDIAEHVGQQATVGIDRIENGPRGLAQIKTANVPPDVENLYQEKLRPQFHFSQVQGWNNDPNGLVYYDGEYHIFWQSNPVGRQWSNMYWGHAVSPDLVHWKELNPALKPWTQFRARCFSGGAGVDKYNTGGFQSGVEKPMIIVFSADILATSLAYSNDRGRTFTIVELPEMAGAYDPSLLWYEPAKHWVMVAFERFQENGQTVNGVRLYVSTDLKKWRRTDFERDYYECATLYKVPIRDADGEPTHDFQWVMSSANSRYVLGSFDGENFVPEHTERYILHYDEGHYYAPQVYHTDPKGRVIQIGWARMNIPAVNFNQGFTLPATLTLRQTPIGLRMFCNPIEELNKLRVPRAEKRNITIAPEGRLTLPVNDQQFDLVVTTQTNSQTRMRVECGSIGFDYNGENKRLWDMPLHCMDGKLHFRLLMDRPFYELFADRGSAHRNGPRGDDLGEPVKELVLINTGSQTLTIDSLELYHMKSIWK